MRSRSDLVLWALSAPIGALGILIFVTLGTPGPLPRTLAARDSQCFQTSRAPHRM